MNNGKSLQNSSHSDFWAPLWAEMCIFMVKICRHTGFPASDLRRKSFLCSSPETGDRAAADTGDARRRGCPGDLSSLFHPRAWSRRTRTASADARVTLWRKKGGAEGESGLSDIGRDWSPGLLSCDLLTSPPSCVGGGVTWVSEGGAEEDVSTHFVFFIV